MQKNLRLASNTSYFLLALISGLFLFYFVRAWTGFSHDFLAYYRAGTRFLQGLPLYRIEEETPFKYPPGVALLFSFFSVFEIHFSKIIFFILSFFSGFLVYKKINQTLTLTQTFILFLVFLRFHNYDFLNVQINHFLVLGLLMYLDLHQKKPITSGVLLGIISSIKVLPLVCILPLLIKREWKTLLGIFISLIFIVFIPLFFYSSPLELYQSWFSLMKQTTPFPAPEGEILQSIQACLWFFLKPFLGVSIFQSLIFVLFLVFLLFYLIFSKHKNYPISQLILIGFSFSILFSPLAWKHNYLLFLPVCFLLFEKKLMLYLFLLWGFLPSFLQLIGAPYWANRSYTILAGGVLLLVLLFIRPLKLKSNLK